MLANTRRKIDPFQTQTQTRHPQLSYSSCDISCQWQQSNFTNKILFKIYGLSPILSRKNYRLLKTIPYSGLLGHYGQFYELQYGVVPLHTVILILSTRISDYPYIIFWMMPKPKIETILIKQILIKKKINGFLAHAKRSPKTIIWVTSYRINHILTSYRYLEVLNSVNIEDSSKVQSGMQAYLIRLIDVNVFFFYTQTAYFIHTIRNVAAQRNRL